jgi:ribosomal subunit interface protein
MQVSVTGRHVEIGDALVGHVHERLRVAVKKYFSNGIDAHVVFARGGHLIGADIAIRVGGGISRQSHGKVEQAAASFNLVAEKLKSGCGATSAGCGTTKRTDRPSRAARPVPS